MEEEKRTLKDEISDLNKNFSALISKKEAKNFRMPFAARVNKRKAKDGYATICYINENRDAKFMRMPIKDGAIMIEGAPHLATTDFMLTYKNKPFLIVPSWNTKPFSPKTDYEKASEEKTTTFGYRLLLNTMKGELIKAKTKISGALIFGIIVALIVGGYFLSRGGGA